jgi:hypothetical protein
MAYQAADGEGAFQIPVDIMGLAIEGNGSVCVFGIIDHSHKLSWEYSIQS